MCLGTETKILSNSLFTLPLLFIFKPLHLNTYIYPHYVRFMRTELPS